MRVLRTSLVVLLVSALGGGAFAVTAAVAARAAAPVWAGTWQTSRGPLEIAVSGSAVTGTFGYSDSRNEPVGHLTGTAAGATVTGTWSYEQSDYAPLDHGPFTLTYATSGGKASFTGKLVFEANGSDFDWDGTCSAGACAAPATPAKDTTAPRVTLKLPKTGKIGRKIPYSAIVVDASGTAMLAVTLADPSGKVIAGFKVKSVKAVAAKTQSFTLTSEADDLPGVYALCLMATDPSGNRSPAVCSKIVMRR